MQQQHRHPSDCAAAPATARAAAGRRGAGRGRGRRGPRAPASAGPRRPRRARRTPPAPPTSGGARPRRPRRRPRAATAASRRPGPVDGRTRTDRRRSSWRPPRPAGGPPAGRGRRRRNRPADIPSASRSSAERLQPEHLGRRPARPVGQLSARGDDAAAKPVSTNHRPTPAAGSSERAPAHPTPARPAAPSTRRRRRAGSSPSSGAHQRRTAKPSWLSNCVMYGGIGSGDALVERLLELRPVDRAGEAAVHVMVDERLGQRLAPARPEPRRRPSSEGDAHQLNASRNTSATSAGSASP